MMDEQLNQAPEYWPQPPDEASTLNGGAMPTTHPPRKKPKSTKKRKKLSESLAGVTVAAVAVVMVATAIPGSAGVQSTPDFYPEPAEICPVCQEAGCPYFRDGMPGLRITVEEEPERMNGNDRDSMLGYTNSGRETMEFIGSVLTESGQRVVLRIDDEVRASLPERSASAHWGNRELRYDPETVVYADLFFELGGEDPNRDSFLYVGLIQDPAGETKEPDMARLEDMRSSMNLKEKDIRCLSQSIRGCREEKLLLMTNDDSLDLDSLLKYIHVEVIEEWDISYDLGKTMVFTESEEVLRNFYDGDIGGITHFFGFDRDGVGEDHFLSEDFSHKIYGVYTDLRGGLEIQFAAVSWHEIFDKWEQLNRDAEKTGHTVAYPLLRLDDAEVNGITYNIYAYYTAESVDDISNYPWIWYYYIPEQEPDMAITDHWGIHDDELEIVLDRNWPTEAHWSQISEVLEQITLK